MLGQDPDHELMGLFARSLRDLGRHVAEEHGGRFAELAAGDSAVALASRLRPWDMLRDVSDYDGLRVPSSSGPRSLPPTSTAPASHASKTSRG